MKARLSVSDSWEYGLRPAFRSLYLDPMAIVAPDSELGELIMLNPVLSGSRNLGTA